MSRSGAQAAPANFSTIAAQNAFRSPGSRLVTRLPGRARPPRRRRCRRRCGCRCAGSGTRSSVRPVHQVRPPPGVHGRVADRADRLAGLERCPARTRRTSASMRSRSALTVPPGRIEPVVVARRSTASTRPSSIVSVPAGFDVGVHRLDRRRSSIESRSTRRAGVLGHRVARLGRARPPPRRPSAMIAMRLPVQCAHVVLLSSGIVGPPTSAPDRAARNLVSHAPGRGSTGDGHPGVRDRDGDRGGVAGGAPGGQPHGHPRRRRVRAAGRGGRASCRGCRT